MKHRAFWIALAAVAVAVLGVSWFLTAFEQVTVTRREAAKAEARRNPYLALERFLGRMGRPLELAGSARALDLVGVGGVLILDRNRRRQLDATRIERLLAWVEAGGYLVAGAEVRGVDDPLLDRLGVRWRPPRALECTPGDGRPGTAGEAPDKDSTARLVQEGPPTAAVKLPGGGQPLTMEVGYAGLQSGDAEPAWRVETTGRGAALLHFGRGSGHVTVLADLAWLADNRRIGRRDHAELLWTLLQHYQPQGRVLLATRLAVPTLGDWLLESAWMVLASGGLLIAAWLARIMPRFGGLAVPAPPERSSLAEHLAAMGRLVARAGGLAHWLSVVRAGLQSRLALRHPGIAALAPAEQARALARLGRLPEEEVRSALSGSVRGPSAFKDAVITLQKLEHLL